MNVFLLALLCLIIGFWLGSIHALDGVWAWVISQLPSGINWK